MEAKTLIDNIGFITKIVQTESINIDIKDKTCTLSAEGDTSCCSRSFKCDEKDMSFCMDLSVLLGIIGSGDTIELEYKNSSVTFKCGRKKGVLSTLSYKPVEVVNKKAEKQFSFSPELKDKLLEVLPNVLLKPAPFLPEEDSLLNVSIKSDGKSISLLTADNLHTIFYSEAFKGDKFELEFPLNYASILLGMDSNFDISTDLNSIYLTNKSTKIKLQQLATKKFVTVEQFIDAFVDKPKGIKIPKLKVGDLVEAIDSAAAIKTVNTDINLNIKKNKLYASCESEKGAIKAPIVDVKEKDFTSIINYDVFMDISRFYKKSADTYINPQYLTLKTEDDKKKSVSVGVVCFAAKD